MLRLLESSLQVIPYTDKIDIPELAENRVRAEFSIFDRSGVRREAHP